MKTIIFFSGYQLPHLGGIERYTDNLSKQFVNMGYKVVIVSSNYNFNDDNFTYTKDIDYIKLPIFKLFSSRYPLPKRNKEFKELINKFDDYDIEAVIVNTRFHLTSLIGAKYGYKKNIPVFLIEHGSQHLTVDNKVLDWFGAIYEHFLTSYLKKYVNYYYGVSKEACNWQKHFNIEASGVWYNSINEFNKEKITKNSKQINILYAGRVLKQKGVIELLNSFQKLSKKYSNIYLNIAGAGNLLSEVKSKYKSSSINFWGKLDFDELINKYRECHIFVYAPNWPEGLPTSILEAGLMDCAVIGSPQGGIKEIIANNDTGLMINNEDELYKAMEKLITNKDLREKLAENLNKKVKNEFLWEKTAKKIIKDIKLSQGVSNK
jgi:glycosyltransferase involved in cell wall biosynthesis